MRSCIAILPLLCACSSFDLVGTSTDTGTYHDTGSISDTAAGVDSATPTVMAPAWFALDGTLQITAGAPVATGSTLRVTFHAAEDAPAPTTADTASTSADTAAVPTLPCTLTPTITAIAPEDAPNPAVSLGWWSLTLTANDDPTCPWILPPDLHLGIGVLDPALQAAMDLAGLQVDGSDLDGLYVQYGAQPLWVFGVAGTDEQFANTTAPPDAPPLPDGLYTLQGLHLLPYVDD